MMAITAMEKSSKISENIVYIILSMGEDSPMDSPEKILCTRRENRAGGLCLRPRNSDI